MRTKKDVSTISYNSVDFLVTHLNQMVKRHLISDYIFIQHKKEKDEAKDHVHLFLRPNTLLDTMDLQDELQEFDPAHPDKPFRCIDFRPSKIDDWILYNLHFAPYLAMKFESREFHYQKEDFFYADSDSFEDMYAHAFRGSDFARQYQLLQALKEGSHDPTSLILNGTIPLNQAANLSAFTKMMDQRGLDRNGRSTHSPKEE